MDLLKPGIPRRVLLGITLQIWGQLTGISAMMYDACQILKRILLTRYRYYIVYIFRGAGLTGNRVNLIASVSEKGSPQRVVLIVLSLCNTC
jgi:hypothetical protein